MRRGLILFSASAAIAAIVLLLGFSGGPNRDPPADGRAGPHTSLRVGPYLLLGEDGHLHVRWTVANSDSDGDGASAILGRPGDGASVVLMEKGGVRRLPGRLLSQDRLADGLGTVAHGVELPKLEPCATYHYRLDPLEGSGARHEFRPPPVAGGNCPGGLRIAAYGDNRTGHKDHAAVVERMLKSRWDLLLNVGDIVDFADHLEEWPNFFSIERALLASAPIVIAPGNHEFWGNARVGLALLKRYFAADGVGGSGDRAFDFGPLHIVVLDLYFGLPPGEGGIEWLRKDLAGVPAERFKIVVLHEPPLTFGHHKPRRPVRLLRPVLEDLAVDVVLAGHSHNYEHFKVGPTHYVTVGGGGAPLHPTLENPVPRDEPYLVKTVSTHHYMEMELKKNTIHLKVIDTDNDSVIEEWKISKQR